MANVEDVLMFCLCLDGRPYLFGVENDAVVSRILRTVPGNDLDAELDAYVTSVSASDCSELVQSAAALAHVEPTMPDGSWYQVQHCRNHGTLIDVNQALTTRGALLFRFAGGDPFGPDRPSTAHVAVSLGDGTTIEARGSKWGVGHFPSRGRGWTHAGLIPGVDYAQVLTPWPIPTRVEPEFDPPLAGGIVSALRDPITGGAMLLGVDWGTFGVAGARFQGGPHGRPYVLGRTPARLIPSGSDGRDGAADPYYIAQATSGETYGWGGWA